ncbi:MAG: 4Fe-4S ferredoxin [Firmicutes bacterium]|nr:4Fe-4S ferredoxin [Bacillota bacterium]
MKRICVFLFSGTGMTKYVVNKITPELEKLQVKVDIYPIEKTQIQSIPLSTYDTVGIAYPVHAFNAPKIVVDFARQLPKVRASNVFLISTAGENHPVNYSSSRLLINILHKKNYHVFYDKQFYMPSNFAVKYDEPKAEQLIATANAEIPQTAHDIANLACCKRNNSFLSKSMAFIGRAEWFGAVFIGKLFYADKKCSHCGICADSCPNHNIVSGNHMRFKWHCGLCMRCLYICPQHAIKVHQPFKFISFEEWYTNEELLVGRKK